MTFSLILLFNRAPLTLQTIPLANIGSWYAMKLQKSFEKFLLFACAIVALSNTLVCKQCFLLCLQVKQQRRHVDTALINTLGVCYRNSARKQGMAGNRGRP